jgi:hypothetical protein
MRPSRSYGRRITRTHQASRVRNWGQGTAPMCRVGVLMVLCALDACGAGERATRAAPVFSYNGSNPFPAVVGEAIALTPAATETVEHYAVRPPLPPGLMLNWQNGDKSQWARDLCGKRHWRQSTGHVSAGAQRDGTTEWPLLCQPGECDCGCCTCAAEPRHYRNRRALRCVANPAARRCAG